MLQSIYWGQLCGPRAWSSTFSCCQGNQGLYIETFQESKEHRRANKTYKNLQHLMINKTWMCLIMTVLPTEISFLGISYKGQKVMNTWETLQTLHMHTWPTVNPSFRNVYSLLHKPVLVYNSWWHSQQLSQLLGFQPQNQCECSENI